MEQLYILYDTATEQPASQACWMTPAEAARRNTALRQAGDSQRWVAAEFAAESDDEDLNG